MIKSHSYSCPHNCEACKIRWHVEDWKRGLCMVCKNDRGGSTYACPACWLKLNPDEQLEIQYLAHKVAAGVDPYFW